MADAPLYKQRRRYTKELHDVDLHGNHKLHVVCTSKGQDVDKMLSTLRRKLPMELDKFLMNGEYTFVGFTIEGDKSKLKLSGLEINSDNYIDIREDHTLWGFFLLPDKLIKYAAIDAFATYESWRIIYDVIMGLDRAKREKESKKKKNKAVCKNRL
ncbi:uncharacterized protein [Aegilops tauschii subsp. strangulata]|uniref:uncharacterized protein n=1 Tax=Aegilops tauschii subsp. strangulata TaxID=200361 RepID=UPI003CC8A028